MSVTACVLFVHRMLCLNNCVSSHETNNNNNYNNNNNNTDNDIDCNPVFIIEYARFPCGRLVGSTLFLPSMEVHYCPRLSCSLCLFIQQYLDGWLVVVHRKKSEKVFRLCGYHVFITLCILYCVLWFSLFLELVVISIVASFYYYFAWRMALYEKRVARDFIGSLFKR